MGSLLRTIYSALYQISIGTPMSTVKGSSIRLILRVAHMDGGLSLHETLGHQLTSGE